MTNIQLIDKILGHIAWLIRREKESELNTDEIENITYGQFKILALISEHEDMTISELASRLKVTKPSMTVRIQQMERIGLVYKEKSETDKRFSYLRLTDMAKGVESAEARAFERMDNFIHESLTKEETEQFYKLLKKIHNSAEQKKDS